MNRRALPAIALALAADFLLLVDLHRQSAAPGGFEAGVIRRIVDDLLEADRLVEADGASVIVASQGHLIEPRARTDIEPYPALPDRAGAIAQLRRILQRDSNKGAGALNGRRQAVALRKETGDRA